MQHRKRLSNTDAFFFIWSAVFFDTLNALINILPFLGQILSIFVTLVANGIFFFWFQSKGVSFSKNPKQALALFGPDVIELIPIWNILPGITLGVVLTVVMVKLEDAVLGSTRTPTARFKQ